MKKIIFAFKYSFLMVLKDKETLFWMLLFPMILCSCFYLAFSNLDKPQDFQNMKIKIGLVEGSTLANFTTENSFLSFVQAKEETLKKELSEQQIDAYIDSEYEVVVRDSRHRSKMAVTILEEYKKYFIAYTIKINQDLKLGMDTKAIVTYTLKDMGEFLEKSAPYISDFTHNQDTMNVLGKEKEAGGDAPIEFRTAEKSVLKIILFTSVAMFSLYGIYFSINTIAMIQGSLSPLAMRIATSPYKKSHLVMVLFITSVFFTMVFNLLLIGFIKYILGVTLFTHWGLTLAVLLLASFLGNSIGILFGISKKFTTDQKTGITTGVLLVLSFACGLSGESLRSVIEEHIPLLNRINPVNVINESLYQINLIGDLSIIPRNLMLLLGGTVILLGLSAFILRRENYDSL